MRFLALKLVALWGWRRAALCIVLGAASALAMEPFSLLPVLFVTIPMLVWVCDGVDLQAGSRAGAFRSGFAVGLCFGFGYFLAGLFWVGSAFFVDANAHAWMVGPVLFFFPLLLAVFWAAGCGLAAAFWSPGAGRLLVLASALATTEWLRGFVLTGFPWNSPGLAVAGSTELSQAAAFMGVSGLNLLVLLIASAPALLADENHSRMFGGRGNLVSCAVLMTVLAGLWGAGAYTLNGELAADENAVRLRVVQPNIAQKEKWVAANRSRIFSSYLELSDAATSPEVTGVKDVDVVIWPESAPPFLLEEHPDALAAIAALLPDHAVLVTGALRVEPGADGNSDNRRIFNSVLAVDGAGAVVARYDKFHLVPFGEYLPFEETLASLGIRKLVKLPGSFDTGSSPMTLNVGTLPPFSPLICYEIIFAQKVIGPGQRPKWLLNVTNDAWFGDSAGPRQHLQQARFRAIEQGLPVVRAANTGISAIIDSRGQIVKHMPLGVRGVIDAHLPAAAPLTLYAAYGDWILAVLIALALAICLALRLVATQRSTARAFTDLTVSK